MVNTVSTTPASTEEASPQQYDDLQGVVAQATVALERVGVLETENFRLKAENQWLREQFRLGRHKLFGASSEASSKDQFSLSQQEILVFNEAEVQAQPQEPEPSLETVTRRRPTNKSKEQRELQLKDLPVEEQRYELPQHERICPQCSGGLHEMGTEERQEIKIIPAQACVVKHIKVKYACRHCADHDTSTPIKTASMPAPAFPGSLASPSAVAQVMSQKFELALPLYRQEQQFAGLGVELPRQTLANWMLKGAQVLEPVYDRLHELLVERDIVHCDDTSVQVLKESGREPTTKSHMWVYCSGGHCGPKDNCGAADNGGASVTAASPTNGDVTNGDVAHTDVADGGVTHSDVVEFGDVVECAVVDCGGVADNGVADGADCGGGGSGSDPPLILYDYRTSQRGALVAEFLSGFSGYLQVDGYQGYNQVPDVTLVGCWAHARRRYDQVLKALPPVSHAHNGHDTVAPLARQGLDYCNRLYGLERRWRDKAPEERHELRLRQSRPLLDEYHGWLQSNIHRALPQSTLGQAMKYSLNQWEQLTGFLKDGRLEIDNNRCERAVKPFVIGRKNWLFSNTARGARSSAIIYSIVETAKANRVVPLRYLTLLFEKLPVLDSTSPGSLDELLPWSSTVQAGCARPGRSR